MKLKHSSSLAALPCGAWRVAGAAVPRGQPRRVRPHVEAQLQGPHRREPRRPQGLPVRSRQILHISVSCTHIIIYTGHQEI